MTQGGPASASNRDLAIIPNPDAKRKPWASHVRGVTTYTEPKEATLKLTRAQSDIIGHMYDRRQLGPDRDLLLKAARQFQRTHENAGYTMRSSGDIREYVDGGRGPQIPITDVRQKAVKRLFQWVDLLGQRGYMMIELVLIGQCTIRQIAFLFYGSASGPNVVFAGRLFRENLLILAKAEGLT